MTHFTACQGAAMPCHQTALETCMAQIGQKFKWRRTGTVTEPKVSLTKMRSKLDAATAAHIIKYREYV